MIDMETFAFVESSPVSVVSVLTADVKVSEQFYGWLLGFGRKAQLIYPATAVEDFKAYLNTVMGLYESC